VASQGDVAKSADVRRVFAETKKTFGKLDVLVNNAGVHQLHQSARSQRNIFIASSTRTCWERF